MSRKVQASKAFMRKSVPDQISDGNTMAAAITQNETDFKNLPFTGLTLQKKTDDFSGANTEAQSGDKNAKETLKTVRLEWKDMFGQTADAVSLEANGSAALILKAGMTPTSNASKKKQKPSQPSNTVAKPGKGKGDCALSVDGQNGVNGYVGILSSPDAKLTMNGDTVAITLTTPGTIYLKAGSRRTMLIDGLPSHTAFCATMFTFNSAGSSPLSNSEEMATQ